MQSEEIQFGFCCSRFILGPNLFVFLNVTFLTVLNLQILCLLKRLIYLPGKLDRWEERLRSATTNHPFRDVADESNVATPKMQFRETDRRASNHHVVNRGGRNPRRGGRGSRRRG
jgi:hypothetical protein